MYRDCKSDTADVTLASRLTGTERCIDSHKHVTVEHLWCAGSDVLRIILVIGIREGTLGPSMISQMDSLANVTIYAMFARN